MKSTEQSCLAINSDSQVLVQKVVLKLEELCRVALKQDLEVSNSNMRKEVQTKVKQDLKEFAPSPTDSLAVVKERNVLNITKLIENDVSQTEILNGSHYDNDKSCQNSIKQEIDNVEYCKENEQNLVNQNLIRFVESEHNIKKEVDNDDDCICNSQKRIGDSNNGTELAVNKTETIKSDDSCLLSLESQDQLCKEIKPDNNIIHVNIIDEGSAKLTLLQEDNYQSNENKNTSDSENLILPVNLSVLKEDLSDNSGYKRIGKRKLSTHSTSSAIDDVSDVSLSSGMDEKQLDYGDGKLFYSGMFNREFSLTSPYPPLLRSFQNDNANWQHSIAIEPPNTGSYILSKNSSVISGICYNHPQQGYSANCQDGCCKSLQYNSMLQVNCIETTEPKSPAPELPVNCLEMPPEQVMRCSCDRYRSRSPVMQGCGKCDKLSYVPNFDIKKASENLNNNGEELFRRIEESLAQTETLKSQEEKLLKRIAVSLNEAESLKYREEELLKKIERSLTEAESLKSREEELLRRIEVSLAHTGSIRSQDEELLMRIEASLKSSNYGKSEETSELESEHKVDLDFSLPLKKRKKRLKMLNQHEEFKLSEVSNLKVDSFPSYPSTPMISIAELLPTCNKLQNPSSMSAVQNADVKFKTQTNNLQNTNFAYPSMPVKGITDLHQNMSFDQRKCHSAESSTCYLDDERYHKNVNSGGKYVTLDYNIKNVDSDHVTVCKTEENSRSCSCERGGTSEISFNADAFYSSYNGQLEIENRIPKDHGKNQNRTLEMCRFPSSHYSPAHITKTVGNSVADKGSEIGKDYAFKLKLHLINKNENLSKEIKKDITSEKLGSSYSTQCSANDYIKMDSKSRVGNKLEMKVECELIKKENNYVN